MEITVPGPAEILRSSQRDAAFIQILSEDLTETAQLVLGQRNWLKWRKWTDYYIPASLYYSLTNLSGNQTLGEEHAGILQVDSSGRRVPGKLTIAGMVVLHVFGRAALDAGLTKLEVLLETKQDEHELHLHQQAMDATTTRSLYTSLSSSNANCDVTDWYSLWLKCWIKLIKALHNSLPFLSQLHLALFFFQKTFYDISKRFTNINYILLRKYFANTNPASQQNLRYLMWMSLVNLFLTMIHHAIDFAKTKRRNDDESIIIKRKEVKQKKTTTKSVAAEDSSKNCILCLEPRSHPSVTPCGHRFCWQCIIEWLSTKQECPICRENVLPSRVIPLQNYD